MTISLPNLVPGRVLCQCLNAKRNQSCRNWQYKHMALASAILCESTSLRFLLYCENTLPRSYLRGGALRIVLVRQFGWQTPCTKGPKILTQNK